MARSRKHPAGRVGKFPDGGEGRGGRPSSEVTVTSVLRDTRVSEAQVCPWLFTNLEWTSHRVRTEGARWLDWGWAQGGRRRAARWASRARPTRAAARRGRQTRSPKTWNLAEAPGATLSGGLVRLWVWCPCKRPGTDRLTATGRQDLVSVQSGH